MNANTENLTDGLKLESDLENQEDQHSNEKGTLIRAQLDALARGDDTEIDRLGEAIHQAEQRRRAVRT